MDVFMDLTGTITSMESEEYAFLKMCEGIKKRFNIKLEPNELMLHILDYRRPYMEKRHIEYYPIRNLIVKAVEEIAPKPLCSTDIFWIMDAYAYYHAKYVRLAPGAKEALIRIRNIAGYMGLITDADTPYTEKVLSGLKIKDFFDVVVTAEDAGVGKPNPKIFHMALQGSKSEKKICIGDSEKRDIEGAKKVGMIAIKIGKESKLADYVVENLLEASKVVEELIL
jgi:putative hydrolase of the HAD superfamily